MRARAADPETTAPVRRISVRSKLTFNNSMETLSCKKDCPSFSVDVCCEPQVQHGEDDRLAYSWQSPLRTDHRELPTHWDPLCKVKGENKETL